jgi:hypothetical protein
MGPSAWGGMGHGVQCMGLHGPWGPVHGVAWAVGAGRVAEWLERVGSDRDALMSSAPMSVAGTSGPHRLGVVMFGILPLLEDGSDGEGHGGDGGHGDG